MATSFRWSFINASSIFVVYSVLASTSSSSDAEILMIRVLACLTQQHDPRLIALAVLICAIACITVVAMLTRAMKNRGMGRAAWTIAATFAFGSGVWALHFIAMLAFQAHMPVAYDVSWTVFSILVAIIGTLPGFALFLSAPRRPLVALLGGTIVGLGITAMHFTGMMAMRLGAIVIFQRSYVIAAIIVGAAFGALALFVAGRWQTRAGRLLGGLLLAFAIVAMHFTGMTAVVLAPVLGPGIAPGDAVFTPALLAIAVAAISSLILLAGLMFALIDARMERRDLAETWRLRQIADSAFEGLMIHRDGVIIDANAAFTGMVGLPKDQIIGRSVLDFAAQQDIAHVKERLATGQNDLEECAFRAANGTVLPVEVLARDIEYGGKPAKVVALRDISERKKAAEQLEYLAHHDPLTGLANRSLLRERISASIALAEKSGESLALLLLDLDRFKAVNDLHGHPIGDQVLVRVAARLRAAARGAELIARLGGDEFVILLSAADAAGASEVAQRVIATLLEPLEIGAPFVQINTSIGISLYRQHGSTADELLKNADTALYAAKRAGRGTARLFDPAMDAELRRRRHLEQDLRLAIRRRTLDIHFQPLFKNDGKTLAGFEALARWRHPAFGPISPADFIPLAEESGLIVPLGRLVLDIACAEAASWSQPHRIAVNISPAQLRAGNLVATVTEVLARTGLPPSRLELEVTESLLIEDTEATLATLSALKALGLRIVLDDFGTGYSSLSYLRRFPFDKLKIDRSFIQALGENDEAMAIVRAIVALADSLTLDVTAEGVETETQLRLLQEESNAEMQGYLLGRPAPADTFSSLLATGAAKQAGGRFPHFEAAANQA
jgi:diguanylate cyclase (GGDEF)-like protein/PAS domain S-box-containing protein